MAKLVLKEAESSIGRGWYVSQFGDGKSLGIKTRAETVARVSIPSAYYIPYESRSVVAITSACALSSLIQTDLVSAVRFTAPFLFVDGNHLGARVPTVAALTLSHRANYRQQDIFGGGYTGVNFTPFALVEQIGGRQSQTHYGEEANQYVDLEIAENFHLHNANGEDFQTTLSLPPYEPPKAEGVLFSLGNLQADKVEQAPNGDVIVYASLSSRIPRGVYSWTTNKEVITNVQRVGDKWKASGSLLTVTAEIYGGHWE